MRLVPLLTVTGLLWCAPAFAAPPSVQEAKRLIDDLELEAALKVLDAVEKTEGNDRATVLEIFTLQGVAWGTLGKDAKTRDSFRKLLVLSPNATLPKDLPPRVRTPYFEAKEWASSNGPLTATPSAEVAEGKVLFVQIEVSKDVLRLARAVRFSLRAGTEVTTVEAPLVSGKAQAPVGKPGITWWADVLSERKGVLLQVGTAKAARVEGEVAEAPPALVAAPPVVESPAAVNGAWRRPLGIGFLGAGAVAAGIGVVLGVQAEGARAQLTNAPRDDQGRVTGLTQRDAAALEATSRDQAMVANVLFGVGGACAAAGLVLVVLGPSSEPALAFSPTAGGVSVSGSF